ILTMVATIVVASHVFSQDQQPQQQQQEKQPQLQEKVAGQCQANLEVQRQLWNNALDKAKEEKDFTKQIPHLENAYKACLQMVQISQIPGCEKISDPNVNQDTCEKLGDT